MGLMMCGTSGGAVPLGVYLTSDMSVASMTQVFQGLQNLLGENAFNGRGSKGPISTMSDDGIEIKGFLEIYPETRRRRCCFHIFQNGQ